MTYKHVKFQKHYDVKHCQKKKINKGGLQSLDILFEGKFFYVAKHIIFMQWVNTGNSTLAVRNTCLSQGQIQGVDWVASRLPLEQPTKKL